jgi:hypothetical protein
LTRSIGASPSSTEARKNIIFFLFLCAKTAPKSRKGTPDLLCQKSDRLRAPRAQFSWQPVGLIIFWVADPPEKNLDLATVYFSSVIFPNLTH